MNVDRGSASGCITIVGAHAGGKNVAPVTLPSLLFTIRMVMCGWGLKKHSLKFTTPGVEQHRQSVGVVNRHYAVAQRADLGRQAKLSL